VPRRSHQLRGRPARSARPVRRSDTGSAPWPRSVPDPRPGLEVLRLLRRGLPLGRDRGNPQPDPSAECERLRRALGPHRPSGVCELDADRPAPAPGPGAPDLRGAATTAIPRIGRSDSLRRGRLRGFGADPPSGGPPAERARRADPRVSRDGGMTNQSFGPLRVVIRSCAILTPEHTPTLPAGGGSTLRDTTLFRYGPVSLSVSSAE
jgi:hypothetical protein